MGMDAARAFKGRLEAPGRWDGSTLEPPRTEPRATEPLPATTISEATEAFLARGQDRAIQPTTLAKYRTFINQLRAYCDGRGYLFIDQ